MEILVKTKTLRLKWDLPIDRRTYEEIGKIMVNILPLIKRVVIADSEGAIIEVELIEGQEDDIKKLRDTLKHVDMWFEGEEDPDVIENERLRRLFSKKLS